MEKNSNKDIDVDIQLPSTLKAPLKEGDRVGSIVVTIDGNVVKEIPVVCCSTVDKQGFKDVMVKVLDRFAVFN